MLEIGIVILVIITVILTYSGGVGLSPEPVAEDQQANVLGSIEEPTAPEKPKEETVKEDESTKIGTSGEISAERDQIFSRYADINSEFESMGYGTSAASQ